MDILKSLAFYCGLFFVAKMKKTGNKNRRKFKMPFIPLSVENVILISICSTCFFIRTFTGEEFTYLLGKLFHRHMILNNENIFDLISILLSAIQTHYFF